MGHLFGHDLFRAIPRLGMAQKSLKIKRRRRRRRSSQGHRSVFFTIFTNLQISAVENFDLISNETTATINFPKYG